MSEFPAPPAAAETAAASPPATGGWARWIVWLALAAALGVGLFAWSVKQRVRSLEQELVKRQDDSGAQATEARLLAKQAQESAREAIAKSTLLETRLAEVALQRGQLDELIHQLARSRDENLVADLDAGLRVALQQTAITGSAEPLVVALKAAEERLARVDQPRLQPIRRAIARDLDRVKAAGVVDVATLALRLDEAVRLADEAPLLAMEPRAEPKVARAPVRAGAASPPTGSASAPIRAWLPAGIGGWLDALWHETRSLVRLTRIDQPDAMLLAPEQSYFVRENLKLKLLNARLAVLSRQFDIAQSDLQASIAMLERYFDRNAKRTQALLETLRNAQQQARQGGVPRPDETLAALAAAAAGK
ncbi:uroporphyrinogen-III C-methyltransferase [Rivibacter subsaxonicus]|uniref:Uroporphyrin-3 C-methyltransferase n=1 Tax=Rivibacter subsaxonicus TaxID=457575 RepID=A0A4Q7W131_9BURK|nr:uroporphyrinogen-III C-methyltransferase [Rivibacter subsaxonicus]RZU02830.1 uroporphyrin-3 C-methyltransferase [Rivibacter subsaxonicus]